MAEQIFKSPGFFEQEIDLSARTTGPIGTPAGIVGTAEMGPAFVPVTIGSYEDFSQRFGALNPDRFGPYAVREFFKNRSAVTYTRVLGAGSNSTLTDIKNTRDKGTVKNAGFKVASNGVAKAVHVDQTDPADHRHLGTVQFITAKHVVSSSEAFGYPVFTDNDSFRNGLRTLAGPVNMVRGMLFLASGSRAMIMSASETFDNRAAWLPTDLAQTGRTNTKEKERYFKLAIYSDGVPGYGIGEPFGGADVSSGARVLTASLNPRDKNYISKILNTDPRKFQSEHHLLYADFPVEDELAPVQDVTADAIGILSGTNNTVSAAGTVARELFGRFDTRYTNARTTKFISQPFGATEYDLFHIETISDGANAAVYKISIVNLRSSTDPASDWGTFDVHLRLLGDNDFAPQVVENYAECSLNPKSDRYIARVIGDKKVEFNFDADTEDERRLIISGRYPNRSRRIRVVMTRLVEKGEVPATALPFGFRGLPLLKTCESLTHAAASAISVLSGTAPKTDAVTRLAGPGTVHDSHLNPGGLATALAGSILPPVPMRFKVTRGTASEAAAKPIGNVGTDEKVDRRFYWGVKTTMLPKAKSLGAGVQTILNPNLGKEHNNLVSTYTKFLGIQKMDALVTGSGADAFNNNKFTLARVAFNNTDFTQITGTARSHMKEAAYIRNGVPDSTNYKISDHSAKKARVTFATLINSSSVRFNRFSSYAKFTNVFYGGFDGLNILDKDNYYMSDRAASSDTGGKAANTFSGGLGLIGTQNAAMTGKGRENNVVRSYREAIKMMTDPMTVNTNMLAVPGMRDAFITDFAADKIKDYSMAIYLMDIANYDEDTNRLFGYKDADGDKRSDVSETSEQFESRGFDNNYVATYFPDVFIHDPDNSRTVRVPSSVAAIGALGFSDKVSYPWFAPAGFNRGGLDFVSNVHVRLSSADRDTLYDARINPIATFPGSGFVIFGQKTLQYSKSALDRVNVRRMLLEVKRIVTRVAKRLLFEQNNAATRARFVGQVAPQLGIVQQQQGIEQFKIVMDDTNNTDADRENNRLNGRIIVVPTRAVEFIAIDFIVTNSGVSFE